MQTVWSMCVEWNHTLSQVWEVLILEMSLGTVLLHLLGLQKQLFSVKYRNLFNWIIRCEKRLDLWPGLKSRCSKPKAQTFQCWKPDHWACLYVPHHYIFCVRYQYSWFGGHEWSFTVHWKIKAPYFWNCGWLVLYLL